MSSDLYCDRSAAMGEGFPNLLGGLIGVGVGLVCGSMLLTRRAACGAIWRDGGYGGSCGCGCSAVHVVYVSDCGPCVRRSCCSCC
jgi:hypothetical protein